MKINDCCILAKLYFEKYGFDKQAFKFTFSQSHRVFGSFQGTEKLLHIQLSEPLVLLNSEEQVEDTILHEIAHALVYIRNGYKYLRGETNRQSHGEVWQEVCREIGCKPQRCYSTKEVVAPPPKEQVNYALYHVPTKKILQYFKRIPRTPVQIWRPKSGGKVNECIYVVALEDEGTKFACPNRIVENQATLDWIEKTGEQPILRPISARKVTSV